MLIMKLLPVGLLLTCVSAIMIVIMVLECRSKGYRDEKIHYFFYFYRYFKIYRDLFKNNPKAMLYFKVTLIIHVSGMLIIAIVGIMASAAK
jgi:ABC-type glycerol-3-phosphate transport system permease component